MGTALTVYTGALSQLTHNRNIASGDQTFYSANAGSAEGAYQLLNSNPDTYLNGTILLNNMSGVISVTSSDDGADALVKGIADNGRNYRQVRYTVRVFPELLAFTYGIYTPNAINLSGNVTVNGDAFATNGVDVQGHAEVNGNIVENEPSVIPSLDPDPYREAAELSSTVFETPAEAEEYLDGEEKTAIIFVEDTGETKIESNNTNLTGSLWVEGDLEISGGSFTAIDYYAAIVVQGDLTIHGNPEINGIIYVAGSTSIGSGNITINGSLISAGDTSIIDLNGNITINYDPEISENWEDIVGLNPTTHSPEIISWEEM